MYCSFGEAKPSYDPCAVDANFMLASAPERMAVARAEHRPELFLEMAMKTHFAARLDRGRSGISSPMSGLSKAYRRACATTQCFGSECWTPTGGQSPRRIIVQLRKAYEREGKLSLFAVESIGQVQYPRSMAVPRAAGARRRSFSGCGRATCWRWGSPSLPVHLRALLTLSNTLCISARENGPASLGEQSKESTTVFDAPFEVSNDAESPDPATPGSPICASASSKAHASLKSKVSRRSANPPYQHSACTIRRRATC
jgi:hypothetical protein